MRARTRATPRATAGEICRRFRESDFPAWTVPPCPASRSSSQPVHRVRSDRKVPGAGPDGRGFAYTLDVMEIVPNKALSLSLSLSHLVDYGCVR